MEGRWTRVGLQAWTVLILLFLFTLFPFRDGAGILVSRDVYEGIRQAQPSDVRTVEEIIRPLEEQVLQRTSVHVVL